jgi:2-polyprenyl-3-methyl-5-hydroxy-6-metoxy-1,4-benzoquinol methylase
MGTSPQADAEERILRSWQDNAAPWIEAVRQGRIASRRLVTDRAIIEATCALNPALVVDIGCGEGWLVRALAERGVSAVGVDAIPALVESARALGAGEFHLGSYEELALGHRSFSADVAVCNFALFGERSVERLFGAVRAQLSPAGAFLVQTLHPLMACGDQPYRDGWRDGSWAGIGGDFKAPAPWYFRTLESWVRLFERHGLRVQELREPVHPESGRPLSVLFVARLAHSAGQGASQ